MPKAKTVSLTLLLQAANKNSDKTNISNIKIHYSEEVVPIEIPEMSVNEQYSLTIFLPAHIADGNLFISYCDGNNNEQECKFKL